MNEKADLMNPNAVHTLQLDFISLEAMLKKRQSMSGNNAYIYPG